MSDDREYSVMISVHLANVLEIIAIFKISPTSKLIWCAPQPIISISGLFFLISLLIAAMFEALSVMIALIYVNKLMFS